MIFNNILSVPGWVKDILTTYQAGKASPQAVEQLKAVQLPDSVLVVVEYGDFHRWVPGLGGIRHCYRNGLWPVGRRTIFVPQKCGSAAKCIIKTGLKTMAYR